jgi:thiamine-phosphate pyrophosphorylase
VFINDRPDIALLARAHGVHLGQQDMHIHDARTLAGGRLLVGASTSNMDEALDSCRAGADVCGVGPMFATTTKHKPVLAGTAYLREYLAHPETSSTPHLAIGGITGETIDELARCGCAGVAVSSAVCGAKDVRGVCEGIVSALRHGAGLAQA